MHMPSASPHDPIYHETMFLGVLVCLAKAQWEGDSNVLRRHGLKRLEDAKHSIGQAKFGSGVSPLISQNLDKLQSLIVQDSAKRLHGECRDFCERFASELAETYKKSVEVGFDYLGSRNNAASDHTTLLSGSAEGSHRRSLRQPMHDAARALGPIRFVKSGPRHYRIE